MKIIEKIKGVRQEIGALKPRGKTIGFVPTMGFLHEGHLGLVRRCREENDVVVVSIFVNPAQFGPNEDFDRYPRDFEKDEKLLKELGVDILFYPHRDEVYPPGYLTYVQVEKMDRVLCGKSRAGHFRGVATVVLKLFNIVAPHRAYFGQKDAQQAVVIKRMVTDLDLDIQVTACPIVRDPDGLALSSRNVYLSASEREAALHLSRGLTRARGKIEAGERNSAAIRAEVRMELGKSPLVEIDYVEVVGLDRLQPLEPEIKMSGTLVAAAIKVGKTRLIDNFILGEI